MRLYPPHILRIYVANRVREGMTEPQVAAHIRQEYHWDALDFEQMPVWERNWYGRPDEYLKGLEESSQEG